MVDHFLPPLQFPLILSSAARVNGLEIKLCGWRRVVDHSSWSTRGAARADLLCLNSRVRCSLDYRLNLIPLRALQESAIES